MGCQTIMLIVYSVLTPSVCLHVYSYRLQANSCFPSSRPPSSFSSSSRSRILFLSSLSRETMWKERKIVSGMPSNRFAVGERDENYVSKDASWWFTRRKLFIRLR